jgi:hypothetical protein
MKMMQKRFCVNRPAATNRRSAKSKFLLAQNLSAQDLAKIVLAVMLSLFSSGCITNHLDDILRASEKNDTAALKKYCALGYNLNTNDFGGQSPMTLAISNGNFEAAEYLYSIGATNCGFYTPLTTAVLYRQFDMAKHFASLDKTISQDSILIFDQGVEAEIPLGSVYTDYDNFKKRVPTAQIDGDGNITCDFGSVRYSFNPKYPLNSAMHYGVRFGDSSYRGSNETRIFIVRLSPGTYNFDLSYEHLIQYYGTTSSKGSLKRILVAERGKIYALTSDNDAFKNNRFLPRLIIFDPQTGQHDTSLMATDFIARDKIDFPAVNKPAVIATPSQSKGSRADFENEVQQEMKSGKLPMRSMTIGYPDGASRTITSTTITSPEGGSRATTSSTPDTAQLDSWQQSTNHGDADVQRGGVKIESEPSGATVLQDGKEMGKTPLELAAVPIGKVNYTLKLAKHKVAQVSGAVENKQTLGLSAKLEDLSYPTMDKPFENSLGMKFVPVPGTEVLFGVWDVRVQDYRAYAQDRGGMAYKWWNPQKGRQMVMQSEECPVVKIQWDEAKAFCQWLTKKEQSEGQISSSQSYRLPMDWEWSVAVGLNESRSGTPKDKDEKTPGVYPWGTQWPPPPGAGNYADATANRAFSRWAIIQEYDDGYATTSPVGSFKANCYGLYDMGGNVRQWCEDYYDGHSGKKVTRGASWLDNVPVNLLSSFRGYSNGSGNNYIGFRCVLVDASSLQTEK